MRINGVKLLKQKLFKNPKGDLLKFVSKNDSFFISFGELYFNEICKYKIKGWIKHKKNQCLFTVPYGKIIFQLLDGRKKSKSFNVSEKVILNKDNLNILIVPPGVWFSFTTNEKKSVLANLIDNPHSDNESIKSKKKPLLI